MRRSIERATRLTHSILTSGYLGCGRKPALGFACYLAGTQVSCYSGPHKRKGVYCMAYRWGCLAFAVWGITVAAQAAGLTAEQLEKLSAAGTVRFVSSCVYAAKEPKSADIVADVVGLAEVSLITWTGGDSSTCDFADWMDARFEGDGVPLSVSDLPWAFAWGYSGAQWV